MDNSETFSSHEIIAENGHANGGNHSHVNGNGNGHSVSEHSLLTSKGERATFKSVLLQLFNCRRVDVPNALTTRIVGSLITLFCKYPMHFFSTRIHVIPLPFPRFSIHGHWSDIYAGLWCLDQQPTLGFSIADRFGGIHSAGAYCDMLTASRGLCPGVQSTACPLGACHQYIYQHIFNATAGRNDVDQIWRLDGHW